MADFCPKIMIISEQVILKNDLRSDQDNSLKFYLKSDQDHQNIDLLTCFDIILMCPNSAKNDQMIEK